MFCLLQFFPDVAQNSLMTLWVFYVQRYPQVIHVFQVSGHTVQCQWLQTPGSITFKTNHLGTISFTMYSQWNILAAFLGRKQQLRRYPWQPYPWQRKRYTSRRVADVMSGRSSDHQRQRLVAERTLWDIRSRTLVAPTTCRNRRSNVTLLSTTHVAS